MTGPWSAPLHVLIIDDSPADRAEAKAALLRGSGRAYRFSEAPSGDLGLALCLQQPPPDCVLLDLGLPDADDLEVLARMPRDDDGLLCVPVVVLTGSVEPGRNQAVLRAGAQDYVGKAWLTPETLTKAVENAIERLALTRGLHEQRRLAAESQRSALRLQAEVRRIAELDRLKSLFLANMSHELRTPLAAIIGFSDLLKGGHVPPESPQHPLFQGHINASARHLLRLVDDVLDLSSLEAGRVHFFPEELLLEDIARETCDILGVEARRNHVELVVELQPLPGVLFLDPTRLRQVLFNLLSNAIKFTPGGGRVTLRAAPEGEDRFRIEVEDEGIGIAAEDIPRLFTEFRQLDDGFGKRYPGAGLGLALTRHLVQAQGGSVGVRSQPQQGSVFWLVLDRVPRPDRVPALGA